MPDSPRRTRNTARRALQCFVPRPAALPISFDTASVRHASATRLEEAPARCQGATEAQLSVSQNTPSARERRTHRLTRAAAPLAA